MENVTDPMIGNAYSNPSNENAFSSSSINATLTVSLIVCIVAFLIFLAIKIYSCCMLREGNVGGGLGLENLSDQQRFFQQEANPHQGLSQKTIESIRYRFYGTEKKEEFLECAVCLDGFKQSDMVKDLPTCHHTFHQFCVDKWLTLRDTCPLCRISLNYVAKQGKAGESEQTLSSMQTHLDEQQMSTADVQIPIFEPRGNSLDISRVKNAFRQDVSWVEDQNHWDMDCLRDSQNVDSTSINIHQLEDTELKAYLRCARKCMSEGHTAEALGNCEAKPRTKTSFRTFSECVFPDVHRNDLLQESKSALNWNQRLQVGVRASSLGTIEFSSTTNEDSHKNQL